MAIEHLEHKCLPKLDQKDVLLFQSSLVFIPRKAGPEDPSGPDWNEICEIWKHMIHYPTEEALIALLLCKLPKLQSLIVWDLAAIGIDKLTSTYRILPYVFKRAASNMLDVLGKLELAHIESTIPEWAMGYLSRWSDLMRLPSLTNWHGQNLLFDELCKYQWTVDPEQSSVQSLTLTGGAATTQHIRDMIAACKTLVSFHYTFGGPAMGFRVSKFIDHARHHLPSSGTSASQISAC